MVVRVQILVLVPPVLTCLCSYISEVNVFHVEHVSAVPFIFQNIADGAIVPFGIARFGRNTDIRQKYSDFPNGSTCQERVINKADNLSFLLIDFQFRILIYLPVTSFGRSYPSSSGVRSFPSTNRCFRDQFIASDFLTDSS